MIYDFPRGMRNWPRMRIERPEGRKWVQKQEKGVEDTLVDWDTGPEKLPSAWVIYVTGR